MQEKLENIIVMFSWNTFLIGLIATHFLHLMLSVKYSVVVP
jgi:hypothetical protein